MIMTNEYFCNLLKSFDIGSFLNNFFALAHLMKEVGRSKEWINARKLYFLFISSFFSSFSIELDFFFEDVTLFIHTFNSLQ